MKKIILFAIVFPVITHAQGLLQLLISFRSLINMIPRILFGLSVIYFFWGGVQFIRSAGDAKTRDDAKNKMIWGLVALFVFVSIFGIIRAMRGIIGL